MQGEPRMKRKMKIVVALVGAMVFGAGAYANAGEEVRSHDSARASEVLRGELTCLGDILDEPGAIERTFEEARVAEADDPTQFSTDSQLYDRIIALIKKYDTNNNGVLDPAERAKLKRDIDKNGNGTITKDEFVRWAGELGPSASTKKEAELFFDHMDSKYDDPGNGGNGNDVIECGGPPSEFDSALDDIDAGTF